MTVSTNINIDSQTKKEAVEVLNELGMNLSTAVNIFLKQLVREKALPFKPSLYQEQFNEETLKAFEEVEDIIQHPQNYKSYTDVDQMMGDLLR